MFADRMARVRASMAEQGVDALLLSVGPDLPWLIGYEAMPLERLTMLVVRADADARLVIPSFETARVVERPELFAIDGWDETADPIGRVAQTVRGAKTIAIGDHTWSRFTIDLQHAIPDADWMRASSVVGQLRRVKDDAEVAALQRAASGVDRVAAALQSGEIPLIGRTEAEVSAELGRRILAEGHAKVNFAIVASGPNASSPHHHPGDRVIQPNEGVLCDFGGTTAEPHGEPGYCSDITRCVWTGTPDPEFADSYALLQRAQSEATAAAVVGAEAHTPDRVARARLADADLARYFAHRIGHGIGVEAHEDPYLVEGNVETLAAGNAFSIEPGFYVPGRWGARLEDIVVATTSGPRPLNNADRSLASVEA